MSLRRGQWITHAVQPLFCHGARLLNRVRLLLRKEVGTKPAENVVYQTLGRRNVRILRESKRLESRVRKLVYINAKRYSVLKTHRKSRRETIHETANRRTLFRHGDKQLANASVRIKTNGNITFVSAHIELVRDAVPRIGQTFATRSSYRPTFPAAFFFDCYRCFRFLFFCFVFGGRKRLCRFRTVTINCQSFQAEFPAHHVSRGNIFNRCVGRHIDRLGNCPGNKRLRRGHHLHMSLPRNAAIAPTGRKSTIEHRKMFREQFRSTFDCVILVYILNDRLDRFGSITKRFQRKRYCSVHYMKRTTPRQLFEFNQGNVRFDSGRIAIHHETDRSGWGQYGRLSVTIAVFRTNGQYIVPKFLRGALQITRRIFDMIDLFPVHFHDFVHRFAIRFERLERAFDRGQFGTRTTRRSLKQRGYGTAQAAGFVRIVRKTQTHEQATQIGITQTEWTILVTVLGNFLNRITGVIDQNFLRNKNNAARRDERVIIEISSFTAESHQIDTGQIARRIIKEHVLTARIGRVDSPGFRTRVPTVDRRIILKARIPASPSCFRNLVENFPRLIYRTFERRIGYPMRGPRLVFFDRGHEIVCDTN